MNFENQTISFKRLEEGQKTPFDLLLLADPSKNLIDRYLKKSEVFTAVYKEEIISVVVLFPLSSDNLEIKNLAVNPNLQGKGIGSFLIENVIQKAKDSGYKLVRIATANSSVRQLQLYQKLGFELAEIKKDFFL